MKRLVFLILCLLLYLVLALVVIPRLMHPDASLASLSNAPSPHMQRSLAQGAPTIRRELVNTILCTAHSPMCGQGGSFYDLAVQNGVNPAFALAIFQHESSYGTQGVARSTRSVGNIVCAGYPRCLGRFRAYRSWLEGAQDFDRLMRLEYFPRHLVTVDQIIPVYAPSSDGNDVAAYVLAVKAAMEQWYVWSSSSASRRS